MQKKSAFTAILLGIVLIMSAAIGLFVYNEYKASKEPKFEYVSLSDEASARAYIWLNEIEDTGISFEDVKMCMGEFNLELVLTPTQVKGVYERSLADGSYEYAVSQAKVGMEKAYRMVVKNRLIAAGFSGECTDEDIESLMQKTFGVSVEEYLEREEITLLPTEEELNEKYAGEVSDEDK